MSRSVFIYSWFDVLLYDAENIQSISADMPVSGTWPCREIPESETTFHRVLWGNLPLLPGTLLRP